MPPRSRNGASTPIPVEALTHNDKRSNLPTADGYAMVTPEVEKPATLLYPRDPSLDPQLVWRGKDGQDSTDLAVTVPPIYIQEKIDPRVLVENLRRTAQVEEDEPEYSLFDAFDGLNDWESVEYYRHAANWSNRMILGDSLEVMASLVEREDLRGKVQTIYFDPPYGIKFGSNWQVSTLKRDVSDGKLADASREVEQIKAFRDTWELGVHSYLSYLRDRLILARDLLTDSGSIFLQIGDENIHLVRSLLDEVFHSSGFMSQITFKKTSSATGDYLAGVADYILWYAKDRTRVKYRPLFAMKKAGEIGATDYIYLEESDGTRRPMTAEERAGRAIPSETRVLTLDNMTSQGMGREKGEGAASWFPVEVEGTLIRPNLQSRWKTNEAGMARLKLADRLHRRGSSLRFVRYLDDFPVVGRGNLWEDTITAGSRGEEKLYVVQTHPRVIERCMLMTSEPGDLVFDPTCGSGTTASVAEQWGRRWITVDTSRVSIALARQRLMGARLPYYLLQDSLEGQRKEAALRGDGVTATSSTRKDVRRGFVYERVPHVTLKSIANNPDIVEGMSREEIDSAIARHAETELLYDRPYEDKKKVRVSGPFTVESLSPHRSVSYEPELPASEAAGRSEDASSSYEKSILDNLRAAGVQNGRRLERLEFEELEPFPGKYLQAVGVRQGAGDGGSPESVAVCLGPEYGTVSAQMVKEAAREALRGQGYDLLLVLGFAFDAMALETVDEFRPSATGDFAAVAAERTVGRLPVLLVRMNPDLAMGDELLKKTKAANLFTVFGEPDVAVEHSEEGLVVEIRGLDVYDPTTGEVRSNEPDEIALWMVDTDYDGESFFVRHCYFSGGGVDPYARLKKALRADIDEAAWATLYGTRSRTFPAPTTGRIAVKAINHYGDEVLKIIDVGDR